MAASLMSGGLISPPTIKHVVPWKYREEFLTVYDGLYSEDEELQQQAVNKINMWKSRAGSKLSVAIESTGSLLQGYLDYCSAKRAGQLGKLDFQLRSTFSLALIRFVNHITEKGQTKAVAQPVHLVAKEFDIPEWIVRLRHEATHNAMPSLDTLVCGVTWALGYLQRKFWEEQKVDEMETEGNKEESSKGPKTAAIRNTIYEFQKVRFQEIGSKEKKEAESPGHQECLKTLQKYLTQNRLRFMKCFLEDGVLVSTEEQLAAFGVQGDDLLAHLPPTIPVEMTEFWRPLLKKIHSNGALALLLQTIMFSVTSQEGLRNYQLVAWLMYLLAQGDGAKGSKRKKSKTDDLFKASPSLPKKMLLTACLQNINTYTAFLLQHLVDKDSLGQPAYNKLTKLLSLHTKATSHSTSSDDSDDSDTVYTVEDVKKARQSQSEEKFSASDVCQLESSVEKSDIPWKLCTDLVDWSTVPFGAIPSLNDEEEEEDKEEEAELSLSQEDRKRPHDDSSDDNDDDEDDDDREQYGHRHVRSSDDDGLGRNDSDDDDDDDNTRRRSKRRKFEPSDDIL